MPRRSLPYKGFFANLVGLSGAQHRLKRLQRVLLRPLSEHVPTNLAGRPDGARVGDGALLGKRAGHRLVHALADRRHQSRPPRVTTRRVRCLNEEPEARQMPKSIPEHWVIAKRLRYHNQISGIRYGLKTEPSGAPLTNLTSTPPPD
jgi:hypothetical protein